LRGLRGEFHDDERVELAQRQRRGEELAYIPSESEALLALGRVNALLSRVVAEKNGISQATLDHDATVIESHKKQALRHYKGGRGYQPSVVYWCEADQVLGGELDRACSVELCSNATA